MTNEELVKLIQDNVNREENLLKLWDANSGIIHITISKYSRSVPYEDLKQSAFVGLCDAVKNYNPEKGSFTNYLGFWLKSYCIEEIKKNYPLSADKNTLTAVAKYHRMQTEFEKRFGSIPSDHELQSLLKLDSATFNRVKKAVESMSVASIDAPCQFLDDDSITLADYIPDMSIDIETEIIDKVTDEELHNELEETLNQLSDDQAIVLRKRYYEEQSVKSVALAMGITENEVRKHYERAFRHIRQDRKRYKRLLTYYEEKFPLAYRGGVRGFKRGGSVTERVAIDMLMKELQALKVEKR